MSWTAYNLGTFTIGYSTFDSGDVLGVAPSDLTFTGAHDDISALVRGYTFSRGRGTAPGQMNPSSGSITFVDRDGIFNAADPSGPLAAVLADRLHPVRLIEKYNGIEYPQFWGWARVPSYQPGPRKNIATLQLVDIWYWLTRAKPVIASTGLTTTGAAFNLLLDAIGWPKNQRIIDAGDPIPDFFADGSNTADSIVSSLLEPEGGTFWQDAVGNAVYRDRTWPARIYSSGTIVDEMSQLQLVAPQDDVINRVILTRPQTSHVSTVFDTNVADKIGYNDLTFESSYFASDAAQDGRAQAILFQQKQARVGADNFQLDNRSDSQFTQLLSRDLMDRVTIEEASGGTDTEAIVYGITKTRDESTLSGQWQLRGAGQHAFTIGYSVLDGTDVLI